MMPSLELCNHVHLYDRLATYFLSAIVQHPPARCAVKVTICYSPDDEQTAAVLLHFGALAIPNVTWNWHAMDRPRLCQRAIGRNECALATDADFFLMGDIDYSFQDGALDTAADAMTAAASGGARLMFPRVVMQSRSHELGDAAIAAVAAPGLVAIKPEDFQPVRMNRAIGGCQWVTGDVARELGYLPGTRFQKPSGKWLRTHSDQIYRKWLNTRGMAIDVPGIYRLRHGERGRRKLGLRL